MCIVGTMHCLSRHCCDISINRKPKVMTHVMFINKDLRVVNRYEYWYYIYVY